MRWTGHLVRMCQVEKQVIGRKAKGKETIRKNKM
jgi:hypothetical protein